MFEVAVLIIACLLNGLLGLVVYSKNPESTTNRLFFALTGSFVLWSLISYASIHPIVISQLVWVRLVLASASLLCLLVFLTFLVFPATTMPKQYVKRIRLAIAMTCVVLPLTLTPLVFKALKVSNGNATPVPAPGIVLFMLLVVSLLGGGVLTVIKKYQAAHGVARNQLRTVILGLAGTFTLIVSTNLIFVVAFHITSLVNFGPAFTLVFSASFAYAIIKHRLFDIKAAIARSVSYLLIIGSMTVFYGVALFGVIDVLLPGPDNEIARQVLSLLLITPLAFSFHSIRNFFDRLTGNLFYKDNYDFQEVLDQIGNIVVAEILLSKILNETRQVLSSALKSEFIEFILIKNSKPYFEPHTYKSIGHSTLTLGQEISSQQRDIIVTDELGEQSELRASFRRRDIAISLRLKTQDQVVGYLIFGPKKSGDAYNTQDKKLLLIIANELAVAIQNALRFEEIQKFNFTLQAKVDEATRKLRHANDRLKQLDETKDDFISMASHQLRTPLTSVKGYLSMVLEGDVGKISPQQREMIGQAFFSSQRMVYLIADLLNVSRLKTGKFVIEPTKVNLAELVEEELSQLTETAAAKKLKLVYDKPKTFPDLMLDETKTRQVVMNFADNAIYYTPAGGEIRVRLVDNPSTIELRVEDNGIGVPKSEQPHLFTKFYRAGNARKARPDGTGLGLFMAKKVVVGQGGSIVFESQEGKGSTFGFMFSKSKLAVPAKLPEPKPQPKPEAANAI